MSDEQPVTLAAIILSGGESSRMGKPKALLDFGGKPAIARIIETARKAGISKILVVVGKHAPGACKPTRARCWRPMKSSG